jgi:hypothetical protein
MHFIEVAFGKVPAVIEGNGPEKEILLRVIYGRPRTDDNPTEPA